MLVPYLQLGFGREYYYALFEFLIFQLNVALAPGVQMLHDAAQMYVE